MKKETMNLLVDDLERLHSRFSELSGEYEAKKLDLLLIEGERNTCKAGINSILCDLPITLGSSDLQARINKIEEELR